MSWCQKTLSSSPNCKLVSVGCQWERGSCWLSLPCCKTKDGNVESFPGSHWQTAEQCPWQHVPDVMSRYVMLRQICHSWGQCHRKIYRIFKLHHVFWFCYIPFCVCLYILHKLKKTYDVTSIILCCNYFWIATCLCYHMIRRLLICSLTSPPSRNKQSKCT